MHGKPLHVSLRLDSEDKNTLSLVFDEVISARNIRVVNAPSKAEFEYMYEHCTAVVYSMFIHWLDTPGIPGIDCITARRHTIIIERADSQVFPWAPILNRLSRAIFAAYPDRTIFWELDDTKDEAMVNAINDINAYNKTTQRIREEIAQESQIHLHLFDSLKISA